MVVRSQRSGRSGCENLITINHLLSKKIRADIGESFLGCKRYRLHPKHGEGDFYPLDLEFTLLQEPLYYRLKDARGIPQVEYVSVGRQYNPTNIAAYSLANYNRAVLTGDARAKKKFVVGLNWFLHSARDGRWHYEFDWDTLRKP